MALTPIQTDRLAQPGLASIHANYAKVAVPALNRVAEIAATIRDELRSRFSDTEGGRISAAKQMSAVPGIPPLIGERGTLLADIGQAGNRTRMALERWLEEQRGHQRREQARDPEFETEAGRQRKLLALAQADDLSRLPADELLADANRLLAAGDVGGTQIRLKAARLAGSVRPGKLRQIQEGIDRELDRTQPHRIAAAEAMKAAAAGYREALTSVVRTEVLLGSLTKAAPIDCDDEIEKVRQWAGELSATAEVG